MPFHVPEEETLDPAGLLALQRQKLGAILESVRATNGFYRAKLGGMVFDAAADPLDALPMTTKDELLADQANNPPFGTNLTYPLDEYVRFHQTSGTLGRPMRCLDRPQDWQWWMKCWGIIYRAAGVTPQDRFMFPFSFGPFIGFWAAFESAAALGNLCLPAGGMTTRARLELMLENGVTVVGCTPTYALRMAEVAAEAGIDLPASAVRALVVAGEPGGSIPATRRAIESAWGARVFDHAGMTEIGPYGFECVEAPGGMHVMESEFIGEVIDPVTARPAAEGHGELVLTNLGRIGSPLVRYRTGDQVRMTYGRCACGRSFARLEGGVLGRLDDMLIIRGNNVYPSAIEAILRDVPGVVEYRLEIEQQGAMADLRIDVEPAAGVDAGSLSRAVAAAVRDRLNFQPRVVVVDPGSLPRFEMKARRVIRRGAE